MSAPRFEVLYDGGFLKDVRVLLGQAQGKLSALLEILRGDPFDVRLHTNRQAGLSALRAGVYKGYQLVQKIYEEGS